MSIPDRDESTDTALAALVVALEHAETAIAGLQAMRATMLAQAFTIAERRAAGRSAGVASTEMELRDVSAEIGAALRVSDRSVQHQISDAWALVVRFPAAHAAFCAGEISAAHVRVIVDLGSPVDDDGAREQFTLRAVDIARRQSATRLRGALTELVEEAMPQSITERHRTARAARSVRLRDLPDGMCELTAVLPAVLGAGIRDRLTTMGRALIRRAPSEAAGPARESTHSIDRRTLDQHRADLLCDLLLTGSPTGDDALASVSAHVEVTVPAFALMGLTDTGAQLAGGIPIDVDTARVLAGAAPGWDRVLTHPANGAVLSVDRYRPSADIRRALLARDRHCRHMGCVRGGRDSDADHIHDAAQGGATDLENFCTECRRHHSLKHATRWQVAHLGEGVIRWTSPLGRTYIDEPSRTVAFTPTALGTWLERAAGLSAPPARRSAAAPMAEELVPF